MQLNTTTMDIAETCDGPRVDLWGTHDGTSIGTWTMGLHRDRVLVEVTARNPTDDVPVTHSALWLTSEQATDLAVKILKAVGVANDLARKHRNETIRGGA